MYIHNVPAVFYNFNPLINKIEQLIDRGYSLNDLTDFDKNDLVSLIMDALQDDQSYVIFDTDEFSKNCDHFKNYLKYRSIKDLFKFTKSLENAAFNKYSDIFYSLFDHFINARKAS